MEKARSFSEVNYPVNLRDFAVVQFWIIIVSSNETHLSWKVAYFGGDYARLNDYFHLQLWIIFASI